MRARPRKILSDKIELLKQAETLGNVSEACRKIGLSRDTYYRLRRVFEREGVEGLRRTTRRKPNLKNRFSLEVEEFILKISLENPRLGKKKIASLLEQHNIKVSAAGVRCLWLRHRLETQEQRLALISQRSLADSEGDSDIEPTELKDH